MYKHNCKNHCPIITRTYDSSALKTQKETMSNPNWCPFFLQSLLAEIEYYIDPRTKILLVLSLHRDPSVHSKIYVLGTLSEFLYTTTSGKRTCLRRC